MWKKLGNASFACDNLIHCIIRLSRGIENSMAWAWGDHGVNTTARLGAAAAALQQRKRKLFQLLPPLLKQVLFLVVTCKVKGKGVPSLLIVFLLCVDSFLPTPGAPPFSGAVLTFNHPLYSQLSLPASFLERQVLICLPMCVAPSGMSHSDELC